MQIHTNHVRTVDEGQNSQRRSALQDQRVPVREASLQIKLFEVRQLCDKLLNFCHEDGQTPVQSERRQAAEPLSEQQRIRNARRHHIT